MLVKKVFARKILDSRGEPTIEVSLFDCKASAPSGKSKGKHETPDFLKSPDYSVKLVNSLEFNIEINSFSDLLKIESYIEKKIKIKDSRKIGANVLFALESVILKALAKSLSKSLWQIIDSKASKFPVPLGNVIEGGLHAHNKNHPQFQEFLIIPQYKDISKNVKLMQSIHEELGKILKTNRKTDEGAWQTNLSNRAVFTLLSKFKNIKIGTDIAASSFYKDNFYNFGDYKLTRQGQIDNINDLIKKFHLFYVEDPLEEEDFKGFSKINKEKCLITGDDLTATHMDRLKRAINNKSLNAMIIKPNQNGSLLELKSIFEACKKHRIKTILSHRSGETLDNALADYAFGFQADFIKSGISTKWREAKLNRLIEIEKGIKNL